MKKRADHLQTMQKLNKLNKLKLLEPLLTAVLRECNAETAKYAANAAVVFVSAVSVVGDDTWAIAIGGGGIPLPFEMML